MKIRKLCSVLAVVLAGLTAAAPLSALSVSAAETGTQTVSLISPESLREMVDALPEPVNHQLYKYVPVNSTTFDNGQYMIYNIKVNQPYAGAYATIEMVCIQDNEWLTSLLAGRYGWGFAHEVGHTIDNLGRVYGEVTNNVWSMKTVLDHEMFSDICIPKRSSDMMQVAPTDSNSFWSDSPTNFYNLSMFWDLEVYSNGFWGKLDSMYRAGTCGISAADNYISQLDKKEKVVAYASKAIGLNLVYYFQKYGYITNPSSNLTNALNQMSLSSEQPKIWYYDVYSYFDNTSSNVGKSGAISVSSYDSGARRMTFELSNAFADAHLGFEIIRDGKVIGFTWNNYFIDHAVEPGSTYTINAYDRSLRKYATTTFSSANPATNYPVRIGGITYTSLPYAISQAQDGDIIYLSKSYVMTGKAEITKNITLMPEANGNHIVLYNGCSDDLFYINGGSLTIANQASSTSRLVIDGNNSTSCKSMFKVLNNGTLHISSGITIQNVGSDYYRTDGSVIYANKGHVNLNNCSIEHSYANTGIIYLTGGSDLSCSNDTQIRYNCARYKGGFVYAANSDNTISLTEISVYRNTSNDYLEGATIYLAGGSLRIGNNTSIYNNYSDFFNRYSAVYASDSAKIEISGRVNITDYVNVKRPAVISPDIAGKLVLRVPSDTAENGFTAAVTPDGGSFDASILSRISYANDLYELARSATAITLVKKSSLKNTSQLASSSVTAGGKATVKCSATGGTGSYTYKIDYRPAAVSTWTTKQDYSSSTSYSMTASDAGVFYFRVTAKDTAGNTAEQILTLTVKASTLTNKTTLSATSVTAGTKVTIKNAAAGGSGSYTYFVYYKTTSDTKWTTLQNGTTETSVVFTPAKAGQYDICSKIADSSGAVDKSYMTLTVTSQLVNKSSLAASSVAAGSPVKVNNAASGGSGSYTYATYYKLSTDSAWTTVQESTANTSTSFTLNKTGTYDICSKVKDSSGTLAKKYLTVKITPAQLTNNTTLAAESVTLGSDVTVKNAAFGGSGSYKYAVYYKESSSSAWITLQDFTAATSLSFRPEATGSYDICSKVKDSSGTIVKKYLTVKIVNAVKNASVINKTSVSESGSIKITFSASGGTAPYTYKVERKKSTESKWTTLSGYSAASYIELMFPSTGSYQLRVTVKDAAGATAVKTFTVKVS